MNAAGAEGYRLVIDSVVKYSPTYMPDYVLSWKYYDEFPNEFSPIMERRSDEPGRYEFRIFAPLDSHKPSFGEFTEKYEKAHQDGFSTVYFGGSLVSPYIFVSQRESTEQSSVHSNAQKDHFSKNIPVESKV